MRTPTVTVRPALAAESGTARTPVVHPLTALEPTMNDIRRQHDQKNSWQGPPTPDHPVPSSSPPPPPPRRTALRVLGIVAAFVFGIPAVLIAVAVVVTALRGGPAPDAPGSAGPAVQPARSEPGQLSLIQLKPGDCFDSVPIPPDGSTVGVASVRGVPCSSPHTNQVVNALAYPNTTWEGGGESKSATHCANSFRTKVRADIRADSSYVPARIHTVVNSSGQNTVYVVCVIGTDVPATGSALG